MVELMSRSAGVNSAGSLRRRLARLHVAWLWLLTCVALVMISGVTGAGMLDGGYGSALFGLLFLVGAPFLLVARLALALTAWAPGWIRAVISVALVLAATTLLDRFLTRWLLRGEREMKRDP
jgi:hypothetical protein